MALSLKRRALHLVRKSVALTSAAFVADNLLATFGVTRPDPAPDEHLGGVNLDADAAYAEKVAGDYLAHCPALGGRIAEVGPGGNAAVALNLLAHGAASVDLLDRFAFSHDPAHLQRLYLRILAGDARLAGRGLDAADLAPDVRFHVGEEAAAERFFAEHRGYDAILSCAVLEHLYDPLGALEAMAAALNPGGVLLHQVDLRDHGMFSAAGHDELTFLTLPGWLYPHMTRRRGRPNRVLIDRYRETLAGLGLDHRLLVTHLVGGEALAVPLPYEDIPADLRAAAQARVAAIRPRLASEFRAVGDTDLAISGFFLAAKLAGKKQGESSPARHGVADAA
jgi:SAM-dependent methyltransferase